MGINFVIGCHRHRERVWMYRGEESEPLHHFFRAHENCIRVDGPRTVEIGDDQLMEAPWMNEYADVGEEHGVKRPKECQETDTEPSV